jgi:corrinoid protein of di/trimethylamine methyltransferase
MNSTEKNMADLQKLYNAVLNGDQKTSVAVTQEALAEGVDPMELITQYMVPAMDEVGRLFECEEYFVPELLLSGRAMKGSLKLLRPLLAARGDEPVGRVVIGTVKGDLHDIGKNLVASMLEGGGFDVLDLGADVPPEKFIEAVKARNANIVCLSALLTVTMPAMRTTIDALKQAGVRQQVKIMVGGAPVTRQFADEVGADGYSDNASTAVTLARTLIGVGKS